MQCLSTTTDSGVTEIGKVICATEEQVPRPRSTNVYHRFYFEWPQARRAVELLEQPRGQTSEHNVRPL